MKRDNWADRYHHWDTKAQPAPSGSGRVVVDEVVIDLCKRKDMGTAKYGTPLRTNNGRSALLDAYQEALDLCIYLKQLLMEMEEAYLDSTTP